MADPYFHQYWLKNIDVRSLWMQPIDGRSCLDPATALTRHKKEQPMFSLVLLNKLIAKQREGAGVLLMSRNMHIISKVVGFRQA
jgi:hypothetical protein